MSDPDRLTSRDDKTFGRDTQGLTHLIHEGSFLRLASVA